MSGGGDVLRERAELMREPARPVLSGELRLGPRIRRQDLLSLARRRGDYRFIDPGSGPADASDVVLQGHFMLAGLAPGLSVHAAAVTDLCDQRSEDEVDAGIKILLLLEGQTELSYGHRRLLLGPAGGQCSGVTLSVCEPERFRRTWRRGRSEHKLVLSLSREWLASSFGSDPGPYAERLRAFSARHLAMSEWLPSARVRMLARELVSPPELPEGLRRAWQTARCLDIALEALDVIGREEVGASARARRQLVGRRLCELLQTSAARQMSLAEIAREVGSNPVSLQQIAREALGMTVFEYLREQAMQDACAALRQGQAVAQVAALAGYASQSNFATAFRRRFGVTPRSLRGS